MGAEGTTVSTGATGDGVEFTVVLGVGSGLGEAVGVSVGSTLGDSDASCASGVDSEEVAFFFEDFSELEPSSTVGELDGLEEFPGIVEGSTFDAQLSRSMQQSTLLSNFTALTLTDHHSL